MNRIEKAVTDHLSAKMGRQVVIRSHRSLGGGCINQAALLETNAGEFVLKWNDSCVPDMFLREAEGLSELRKAAGEDILVPEVYGAKLVDDTPGFLILQYMKPSVMHNKDDEKLGRGLARIHRYENRLFGFWNNNYCGATPQNNEWKKSWCDFFAVKRLHFLLGLIRRERPMSFSETMVFETLISRLPDLIPSESRPVLIHGDLWSGNYMISSDGPVLLDPATSYSDREMEFAIITMFGGFSKRFFDAYGHEYPLAPDWQERNRLYQIYHILNHYFLFGGGYKTQAIQAARYFL